MCVGMLTHFKKHTKKISPAELYNTTLHSSTAAQQYIIKDCVCVWEREDGGGCSVSVTGISNILPAQNNILGR